MRCGVCVYAVCVCACMRCVYVCMRAVCVCVSGGLLCTCALDQVLRRNLSDRPAIITVGHKVKVMIRVRVKVRIKVWNRVGSCSPVGLCYY